MTTITVSKARENLYDLVKSVSKGIRTYEIKLRGSKDSAILINKSEFEAWQETLDILNSPSEIKTIRKAKQTKKTISHQDLLKALGLKNGN